MPKTVHKIRSISVSDTIWHKLKTLAKEEERSMSGLIREAVVDLFEKREERRTRYNYDPITDTVEKRR